MISDDRGTGWLLVAGELLGGQGRVAPRLTIELEARAPLADSVIEIQLLKLRLHVEREYVGETTVVGGYVGTNGNSVQVEIPVSREGLAFIGQHVAGDAIEFEAELSGLLRMDSGSQNPDAPATGSTLAFGRSRQVRIRVRLARSDWFARVLQPLGAEEFLFIEASIPRGRSGKEWAAALKRLSDADKAYATGVDPSVFSSCRAALDALPGAPKDIVRGLDHEKKTQALDDVFKYTGRFFHLGRHVDREGDTHGEFPVDHLDAEFALGLTKLLVAYASRRFGRADTA